MIYPVYFPHTLVPPRVAEAIVRHFGGLDVLSPLEPVYASDPPGIRRRVTVAGDEDRLRAFLKEYRNFAAVSREKASSFLMGSGGKPLEDPDWTSQIRSDILNRAEGRLSTPLETKADDEDEKRLWARAFLQIAQDWDEENQTIDSELDQVIRREKHLLEQLMGEADEALNDLVLPHTPAGHTPESRIPLRLAAWSRLFALIRPGAGRTGQDLYLTHSPDVIAHLEEFGISLDYAGDLDLTRTPPEQLAETITALQDGEDKNLPKGLIGSVILSLYRSPHVAPAAFFARLTGLSKNSDRGECGLGNTVIGLITI